MDTIKLSIVTPNGEIYNGNVKTITLPGKDGEFGVMARHSSLVSALTVGVIEIEKKDATKELVLLTGDMLKSLKIQ
jgi:F-type H+-transporting ATPase subunit epsilon